MSKPRPNTQFGQNEYLPEGYPRGSVVLREQVSELLEQGASEIAAAERYLAGVTLSK